MTSKSSRLLVSIRVLLVMIVTLMALGAGVRTMNAGLSCPDWPLCFGKVIPDFHPGVWFEFVHRAYAGLVAILFFGIFVHVLRSKVLPRGTKAAVGWGMSFLTLQIVMGGLTVLLLVKEIIVTSHLMLATLFFVSVLWLHEQILDRGVQQNRKREATAPFFVYIIAALLPIAILFQIFVGGLVASTYAGSVCVDWPLCNGQWVPTWKGAIGLQIIHRFFAYFLAVTIIAFSVWLHTKRQTSWMSSRLASLARWNAVAVAAQVCVGILNLLLFIPAWLTVIHQSLAIALLAINIRLYFEARTLARRLEATVATDSGFAPQAVGVSG